MKLRLLLFEKCDRSCKGCCNKDWDLSQIPIHYIDDDFSQYDKIMLTGGEPMLDPVYVLEVIHKIKEKTDVPIIVYTAKIDNIDDVINVLDKADGLTITLHEQEDVEPFLNLHDKLKYLNTSHKSLRLNVFHNVYMEGFHNVYMEGILNFPNYIIKQNIEWIKNCPLPENEVFYRLNRF
jgi:organic radical activating enzyme